MTGAQCLDSRSRRSWPGNADRQATDTGSTWVLWQWSTRGAEAAAAGKLHLAAAVPQGSRPQIYP